MVECKECSAEIEETDYNGDFYECPECGQEYIFDPTEVSEEDQALKDMEEALDKQEKESDQEDEEEDSEVQQQVIIPSGENDGDSENPECEHCGKEMDEAPEHIEADWLCHNDGCEGSFRDEDLEEDSNSEEEKDGENQLWPPT